MARKSDSHPHLGSIIFFFLTHLWPCITLLGSSESVGEEGPSLHPQWLVPSPEPVSLPQFSPLPAVCPKSLLRPQEPVPALCCFWLLTEVVLENKGLFKEKNSSVGWASPCFIALWSLQVNDACFMSLKGLLHRRQSKLVHKHVDALYLNYFSCCRLGKTGQPFHWGAGSVDNLADQVVCSFRLVSKNLSRIIAALY